MLRRLLLVAWIGSHHAFATEAAELGAGFTDRLLRAGRALPVRTHSVPYLMSSSRRI